MAEIRPWPADPVEAARLDRLVEVMRDETASRQERMDAAVELAPYFHEEAGEIEPEDESG